MTWSISASGTKAETHNKLTEAKCDPTSVERGMFEAVKGAIFKLLDQVPDGHVGEVSASGHGIQCHLSFGFQPAQVE